MQLDSAGVGIRRVGNSADPYVWPIKPLRLTAFGHEFAAAISKPDVFKILKEKFNKEGPMEIMKAAIEISP